MSKRQGFMKTKPPRTEIAYAEENFEECPPRADAMIHSLRAFGYDLGMAIADLIDNSIFPGASSVSRGMRGTTGPHGYVSWMTDEAWRSSALLRPCG